MVRIARNRILKLVVVGTLCLSLYSLLVGRNDVEKVVASHRVPPHGVAAHEPRVQKHAIQRANMHTNKISQAQKQTTVHSCKILPALEVEVWSKAASMNDFKLNMVDLMLL